MTSYVDTKLDLRTPSFDGSDVHWEPWALKLEAYCELVGLAAAMEVAAEHDAPVQMADMSDDNKKITKSLYALLVSKTDGRSFALVSLVPGKSGLEAWRRLKIEYESTGGARTAAMLRGILNPKVRWQQLAEQGRDINEIMHMWEKDVAQYKLATAADIDGSILIATVLEHPPEKYQPMLKQVPMTQTGTY